MREYAKRQMQKPKPRKPSLVRAALQTRRQRIKELLVEQALSFGALRKQVGGTVCDIDSELRHVQRSLHKPERLVVVAAARCVECDFAFRDRELKYFHAPGRCPACRSTRIFDPIFKIEGVLTNRAEHADAITQISDEERCDGNGE